MTEIKGIVIASLGPGNPGQMTREVWEHLSTLDEVWLRTRQHPTVEGFPPDLRVHSFDDLYESAEKFEDVYAAIIEKILALGRRPEGVTYAVPGHAFVAEATGPEIVRRAREEGIPVRVMEGVSFLEPVFSALQVDPFTGIALVDALDLGNLHTPHFPPDQPMLIAQVYSRSIASDVKLTLNAVYPDQHRVRLVHAAGTPDERVEDLALYEIDRSDAIGLLTILYVPPLAEATSLEGFQEIVAHLRAPDGCPWDREQTLQSLGPSLLEETYEALEAIDRDEMDGLEEELGDLMLLVTMFAQIGAEEGYFGMADIIRGIQTKIVRRHPHVFGDEQVSGSQDVLRNWQKLKQDEREKNGQSDVKGLLDGVSRALPALLRAQEYQSRAAQVGFDWPAIDGVKEKLLEEWNEVNAAQDASELESELGDLLFATVNLVRWYKVDAETALRKANERFYDRFRFIETSAGAEGRKLDELTLDEMEQYWQAAKRKKL